MRGACAGGGFGPRPMPEGLARVPVCSVAFRTVDGIGPASAPRSAGPRVPLLRGCSRQCLECSLKLQRIVVAYGSKLLRLLIVVGSMSIGRQGQEDAALQGLAPPRQSASVELFRIAIPGPFFPS